MSDNPWSRVNWEEVFAAIFQGAIAGVVIGAIVGLLTAEDTYFVPLIIGGAVGWPIVAILLYLVMPDNPSGYDD